MLIPSPLSRLALFSTVALAASCGVSLDVDPQAPIRSLDAARGELDAGFARDAASARDDAAAADDAGGVTRDAGSTLRDAAIAAAEAGAPLRDAGVDAARMLLEAGAPLDGGIACRTDADCGAVDPCASGACVTGRCLFTSVEADADGDGYLAVECGGLDCDDSNPAVNPGAGFSTEAYTDPGGTTTFDWDCSGIIEAYYTHLSTGGCYPMAAAGTCSGSGWIDGATVPACGVEATYRQCTFVSSTMCMERTALVVQACR